MDLEVYTDGSCYEEHTIGGWGVYIVFGNRKIQFSGSLSCTSSFSAELIAILKAFEYIESYLSDIETINLFTDCDFIAKVAQDFSKGKRGFYRTKTTLKYKNLIDQVFAYTSMYNIKWYVVKSHRGVKGNEIADNLAKKAARIRIKQKRGLNPL